MDKGRNERNSWLMKTPLSPNSRHAMAIASKVPEITLYFWIIKLLSTAMGETSSDYLVYHLNPFLAVALGGLGFAIALALQFSVRRYVAWIYWLLVAMVSIFGTMVADAVHIVLGVPYAVSTFSFVLVLATVLMAWHQCEKTLSIHSVFTFRREAKPEITPSLFLYCVEDYWRKRRANEKTLSFRELANETGSPGQILKLPEEDLRERMEQIHADSNGVYSYKESTAVPHLMRSKEIGQETVLKAMYGKGRN